MRVRRAIWAFWTFTKSCRNNESKDDPVFQMPNSIIIGV